MRVVAIRVKNFKALRDVSMKDIPGFAVMVGANGTGKSTFIGVFDFLKDCLKNDVRVALRKRGGFAQVVSRGHEDEAIEIELQVRMGIEAIRRQRLVTYHLRIVEENRRIAVAEESLRFKRGAGGAPYHFIRFRNGKGEALPETFDAFDPGVPLTRLNREEQDLDAPYILALKGLGQFRRFDVASQLRELIENWVVSDFHIEDARVEPDAGIAEHLDERGSNIALYAQYLREEHADIFQTHCSPNDPLRARSCRSSDCRHGRRACRPSLS
ncbi:MAG: AAA family ATPase [Rhodobacteraceae bacterium]|nr:AAA family ATPase [Paracoccaceae bacterium]